MRTSGATDRKPATSPVDPDSSPQPIHLGLRLSAHHLRSHLKSLEASGVNHVALNLRRNQSDIEATLRRLAEDVPPEFAP